MLGHGKCPNPKCNQPIGNFELDPVKIGNSISGPFFHGISICCPFCQTILGVSFDPVSVGADIAQRVAKRIQGKTP
jgi:hypothetical protein